MKNRNAKLIYIALVAIAAIFIFTVYVYYQTYFGTEYTRAVSSQNTNNICQVPLGYTEEAWKEHMSHHPDQYRECLR